jgi:hypothetical protein
MFEVGASDNQSQWNGSSFEFSCVPFSTCVPMHSQEQLVDSADDAGATFAPEIQSRDCRVPEVLTNETNALSYELQLAQARGNELTSLVQLYQALGGGWR